MYDVDVMI